MMFRASAGISNSYKSEEYTATGTPARIVRGDCVGEERAWGLGTLTSVFYSSKMSGQRKERGEGKTSPIPNIGVFNVRRCSTNEEKKGEIGNMFFEAEGGCVCSK